MLALADYASVIGQLEKDGWGRKEGGEGVRERSREHTFRRAEAKASWSWGLSSLQAAAKAATKSSCASGSCTWNRRAHTPAREQ